MATKAESFYADLLTAQIADAVAAKHGINDPACLNEIFQLTRHNLIQGFRIGQNMKGKYQPS